MASSVSWFKWCWCMIYSFWCMQSESTACIIFLHWLIKWAYMSVRDLLYSKEWIKVILLPLWPQKLYTALRFGKDTCISSVLTHTDFVIVKQHSAGESQQNSLPAESFFVCFFLHGLGYELETWYIHLVGSTAYQVWVSSYSDLFDPLYTQK